MSVFKMCCQYKVISKLCFPKARRTFFLHGTKFKLKVAATVLFSTSYILAPLNIFLEGGRVQEYFSA